MRNVVFSIGLVISCATCAVPEIVEIPPIPGPPVDWPQFSASTIQGSECPKIDGVYLEPPLIHRLGHDKKYLPIDDLDLYSGYIPFHLADRNDLAENEIGLLNNHFVIRQSNESQFFFLYLNKQTETLVEYRFQSEEGDFQCQDGQMIFPIISYYVMIEGSNLNFQVRNILLKDETGALVIQSTRGPFRGNPAKAERKFMYEFFRYPQANEVGDD